MTWLDVDQAYGASHGDSSAPGGAMSASFPGAVGLFAGASAGERPQ